MKKQSRVSLFAKMYPTSRGPMTYDRIFEITDALGLSRETVRTRLKRKVFDERLFSVPTRRVNPAPE